MRSCPSVNSMLQALFNLLLVHSNTGVLGETHVALYPCASC